MLFCPAVSTEKRGSKPVVTDRRLVREIEYPTGFFPGIRLQCSVAFNGNAVRVRAHRLVVPVEIEGMRLEFEFDEKVFRQQMRLAPLPESTFRGARGLADRIATAFRQRGRRTEDGGWALSAEDLIHALYGPEATPEEAGTVLIALGAMDLGFVDGGLTTAASIWAVAALGMAAGTGEYVLAIGGTLIVVIALAPLRAAVRRGLGGRGRPMELRVRLWGETTPAILTAALAERGVGVRSVRRDGEEITVEITLPRTIDPGQIAVMCAELDDLELLELADDED